MNKEKMIQRLNDDLADEFAAIVQYTTYSAKATGPYRPQLAAFFQQEITDELGHAQYLSDKIVALGGEPVKVPGKVAKAENNKEMLQAVLQAENRAIDNYSKRIEQAEEFGDKGLVVQLEDMVRDETTHSEETERILRNWPL